MHQLDVLPVPNVHGAVSLPRTTLLSDSLTPLELVTR